MITIEGKTITAKSREGISKTMSLDKWVQKMTNAQEPKVLPDGVRCVIHLGQHTLMIHQSPPALRNLKWIRHDSPVPYGPGTLYRDVTIALPYVITFSVFGPLPRGGQRLTEWNECYFSQRAIVSLQDDVCCYPGLLNCSKWPESSPRSKAAWICTQKLNYSKLNTEPDHDRRTVKGLNALLNCLFDSGFNYSSENHEGNSWYTATKDMDKRIGTIEEWEKQSGLHPMFVLDVPWIPTGETVEQIADRVLKTNGATAATKTTAADLERIVSNSQ